MTDTHKPAAKEKLIITMEVDELPESEFPLQFSVHQIESMWLNRFHPFRNWRKITMHNLRITAMNVEKVPPSP